jgi:hypothetical protein
LKCGVHLPNPVESFSVLEVTATTTPHDVMAQSDEEDDYMNMVFEDAPKGPKYETSLQRAARKRKEVRLRAPSRYTRLRNNRARPGHARRRKQSAKLTPKPHARKR